MTDPRLLTLLHPLAFVRLSVVTELARALGERHERRHLTRMQITQQAQDVEQGMYDRAFTQGGNQLVASLYPSIDMRNQVISYEQSDYSGNYQPEVDSGVDEGNS